MTEQIYKWVGGMDLQHALDDLIEFLGSAYASTAGHAEGLRVVVRDLQASLAFLHSRCVVCNVNVCTRGMPLHGGSSGLSAGRVAWVRAWARTVTGLHIHPCSPPSTTPTTHRMDEPGGRSGAGEHAAPAALGVSPGARSSAQAGAP